VVEIHLAGVRGDPCGAVRPLIVRILKFCF